jgi:DNA helicase-2/ATP-dependent DNA helicase PcrA
VVVPGPEVLGRSVIVDGAGPVPAPWSGAPELVVDEGGLAAPGSLVTALHLAWSDRRPVVIRLEVDPARFREPRSVVVEPWTLAPGFEVWEDRLHFLVWANSYDARREPDAPVWWWARKAERLGATESVGAGDVRLADGRPAWIDGGPRCPWPGGDVDGAVVVHRESVEWGSLAVAAAGVDPAADLAPDQLAAVAHPSGPTRIIAPAGSGKTRVLTERLRHLVVDRGWERDAVLAVAYNKKAQEELDARTASFSPRTRTLNSLGLSLLTQARGRAPRMLDERDVRRVVERLAPAPRRRSNTDPIGPYLEGLSSIRLGLRDPEEVEASRDDVPGLAALWPGFREVLAEESAVDFDEQIYGAIEILLADGGRRAAAQQTCRHLLVDEFQDLTPAHVLLLRLLSAPVFDCFGVGDDDQVIYGHAGADPRFLIGYERLFPRAGDHPLEVNYRCPPEVVEAAATLLSYNRRRVAKVIRSGRERAAGSRAVDVRLHGAGGGAAELVRVVQEWLEAGAAPTSIAVLTRVNASMLAPSVALVEAGVPVSSTVRPEVLERTGLRGALAYLRIATAPDGHIAGRDLAEVLRRPSRGLPPWFSDRLRRRSAWSATALAGLVTSVAEKDAAKVERFVDDIVALRAAAAAGAGSARLLRLVRVDIGLGGAMTLLDGGRGNEGSSHVDDLEALEAVAELHGEAATLEVWLRERLGRRPDADGVTVSTVHRVKGMEWDRVAVYGVSAGLFPHRLAEDVEEERRVLHVAITRGREQVALVVDRTRPSPMLDEMRGKAPVPAGPTCSPGTGGDGAGWTRPEADVATAGGPGDTALEETLRSWRRRRATADGVPAYVVFADRTLKAIAASRPATLVALRSVDGIGPTKLELYGEDVLALVASAAAADAVGSGGRLDGG